MSSQPLYSSLPRKWRSLNCVFCDGLNIGFSQIFLTQLKLAFFTSTEPIFETLCIYQCYQESMGHQWNNFISHHENNVQKLTWVTNGFLITLVTQGFQNWLTRGEKNPISARFKILLPWTQCGSQFKKIVSRLEVLLLCFADHGDNQIKSLNPLAKLFLLLLSVIFLF